MDKKSKYFLIIFSFFLLAVVMISFVRYVILKDYLIKLNISCDPKTESCFISRCDPDEDQSCLDLAEEDRVSYYKILTRKANDIVSCQTDGEDCLLAGCGGGAYCEETYCNKENQLIDSSCSTGL